MEARDNSSCVAVCDTHEQAELAIRALRDAGFDMKKLSIIGPDYHTEEHTVGFYNSGERVKYWGKNGAFWGGVFGVLFAPAFFWIPGIGPILTGGVIGSLLMGVVEGAAVGRPQGGGASALAAAFGSLGIPKNSITRYEKDLKAGKFLLIAGETPADTERARAILAVHGGDVQVHSR